MTRSLRVLSLDGYRGRIVELLIGRWRFELTVVRARREEATR